LPAKPVRVLHLFLRFRPQFAGDGLYFEKLWPGLSALRDDGAMLDEIIEIREPTLQQL
jgi:hypothetical protein